MKIDSEKIKNLFKWRNIRKSCMVFMEKKISWVIFFLIFFLFCYGAYLWYGFVYHPQWSEEKKRLYENEKGHGTMLNRQKLDEALKNYNLRGENFNRVIGEQKDIFRLNN